MTAPNIQSPPALNIPNSTSTVDVHFINTTARVDNLDAAYFLEPTYKSYPKLQVPAFSFLITHAPTRKKYIFDLGIRKDWQNLAPRIADRVEPWGVTSQQNVADTLSQNNVSLDSISGIIWSHHHFDHTGDPSTFPSSTDLVVGPGFWQDCTPGYPSKQDGTILESDYKDRHVQEISFTPDFKVGPFHAHDFFGDGSFYLLDTPGHCAGHMCGLARTTSSSSSSSSAAGSDGNGDATYILMGGDVAHHAGEFRPSPYLPFPSTAPSSYSVTTDVLSQALKSHRFNSTSSNSSEAAAATSPFVEPRAETCHDPIKTKESLKGIQAFDAHPNIWTVIAHDESVDRLVDFFPRGAANGWRKKGWREKTLWGWVGDFVGGVVD